MKFLFLNILLVSICYQATGFKKAHNVSVPSSPQVSVSSKVSDSYTTLLTIDQDTAICNYGKNIKTICTSIGAADQACTNIAASVKGTTAKCIQKNICSFHIGQESKRYKRSLFGSGSIFKHTSHQEYKLEANTVYITTDKTICFEKKPGVQRICPSGLIIVNQLNNQPSNANITPSYIPQITKQNTYNATTTTHKPNLPSALYTNLISKGPSYGKSGTPYKTPPNQGGLRSKRGLLGKFQMPNLGDAKLPSLPLGNNQSNSGYASNPTPTTQPPTSGKQPSNSPQQPAPTTQKPAVPAYSPSVAPQQPTPATPSVPSYKPSPGAQQPAAPGYNQPAGQASQPSAESKNPLSGFENKLSDITKMFGGSDKNTQADGKKPY